MSTWPDQGVHYGVPFATYRACDMTNQDDAVSCRGKSVSKSLITDFLKDPATWRAKPKREATAAMRAGSLFDCLMTDAANFELRYVVSAYAEYRTNEAKAWRAEQMERGLEVITTDQLTVAQAQLEAVWAKPEAAALLTGAQYQVAFRHKTKYPFGSKGLIDVVPTDPETLVDIKTCGAQFLESRRALQRHILDFGYHIQAGAYCDGYSFASGDERRRFKFIFVGASAPYTVAVVELPLPAILLGAQLYRDGVNQLADCLETGKWPSIWDGEIELDLPDWVYTEGVTEA